MKRLTILLIAMATLVAAGCDSSSKKIEVSVVSAGEWTIEGNYSWVSPSTYAGKGNVSVTFHISSNTTAKERLIELWEDARTTGKLDELNFKRWNILDEKVHQNYQALGSYNAEVGTVKTYINERLKTLDALIRR